MARVAGHPEYQRLCDRLHARLGRTAQELLEESYARGRKIDRGLPRAGDVKAVYTHGHTHPELISPDNWKMDNAFLARPGAKQVQLDLFYDYRTNVELYPKWQAFLRDKQPTTIIFWGQSDIFFTPQGGDAYLDVLPKAEMHRLDSGHFAVEDSLDEIASKMSAFYEDKVAK